MELGGLSCYDELLDVSFIFEEAPCCYPTAAPVRSTVGLSQASTAALLNVGAGGGQPLPLAAAQTDRGLFCMKVDF